jgi:hypothetical protein
MNVIPAAAFIAGAASPKVAPDETNSDWRERERLIVSWSPRNN